jgi:transketolase C-terminal domain/subunit
MGILEAIFGTVVVVLAGLAVIGALVVVVVAEVYAVRRTVERHRNPPLTDADFWRQQRALTEPK